MELNTYRYTIHNKDTWRITDTEIIIVATDKRNAKKLLADNGYNVLKTSEIIKLDKGVHIIQEEVTE